MRHGPPAREFGADTLVRSKCPKRRLRATWAQLLGSPMQMKLGRTSSVTEFSQLVSHLISDFLISHFLLLFIPSYLTIHEDECIVVNNVVTR